MKIASALLTAVVLLPATALGHGEIYFPKLISPAELATTGIVLLNPDPMIANVTLYLLSPQGSRISSIRMQIRPGEQIAKVASELFPDAATDGWIGVSTDAEEMDAFWLTYDAEMTYLDGGEAAQVETTGADQVIPLVAGDTELTVLCLSGLQSAVPVTIRLFGSDGSELAPAFTEDLPSIGALRAKVSLMFPSADMAEARYMRITSSRSVASSALIKHFLVPFEAAVVNGVNVGTSMHMNFPHIVNGKVPGANYTTTIGVTNLSNSPQTISITFNPDAGIPIVATRDLTGN